MLTFMPYDFRPITNRHVIFSSDDNPNYYFLLPIVSLAWKKLEYKPVISLIWDINSNSDLKRFIIDYCNFYGAKVHIIDSNLIKNDKRFNGYNLSMLSQISRFCSPLFFTDPDDYYLTSDADMIPTNKSWFHQQDNNKIIHLFYANGYHHKRYPICYIGMKSRFWESLFNLYGLDIYSGLNQIIRELHPYDTDENQWGYDEIHFFNTISSHFENYKNHCQMINRKIYINPRFKGQPRTPRLLPYGRLDRSNFYYNDVNLDENGWIDIHCMREPWKPDNWRVLREALENLVFEENEMKLINSYYERFMEYV